MGDFEVDNGNNQNEEKIELIDAPEFQDLLDPVKDEVLISAESVDHIDSQISMAPQSFDMVRPMTVGNLEKSEDTAAVVDIDQVSPDLYPEQTQPVQPIEPIQPISVVNNDVKAQEPCNHKNSALKTILILSLVLISMAAAATGGYMWRDKTATDLNSEQSTEIDSLKSAKTNLESQLSDKTDELEAAMFTAPLATALENIKASITSKNTAALEGYMSSSIIAIDGSSFRSTGDTTATQVVTRITNFIKDATTPWDFDLTDAVKESYAKLDYKMSNNLIIGKSANGKVISFTFDSNGKLSSVLLAATDTLLK